MSIHFTLFVRKGGYNYSYVTYSGDYSDTFLSFYTKNAFYLFLVLLIANATLFETN